MATLPKSPMKTKIEFLYTIDTAKEKPHQQVEIIALGPVLLSSAHVN